MNDRATHLDLLDQVATSEEEARAVRRILGPATWPGCCGACGQGRKPCPHACQVATEDDDTPRPPKQRGDNLRTLALWVLTALAIGATLYASGVRL